MPGPASRLCARKSKGAQIHLVVAGQALEAHQRRKRHELEGAGIWPTRGWGGRRSERGCLTERAYPARKESLGIGLFARGVKLNSDRWRSGRWRRSLRTVWRPDRESTDRM